MNMQDIVFTFIISLLVFVTANWQARMTKKWHKSSYENFTERQLSIVIRILSMPLLIISIYLIIKNIFNL